MSFLRTFLREVLGALASLVFPAPCRICETTLLTASRIPICEGCLASLRPLAGPACQRCGRPLASGQSGSSTQPLCHLCRRDVYGFDLARSYAPYDSTMVRAMTLLKYSAVSPLGDWFGTRLAELAAKQPELSEVDVIVPVPLHESRLRERGYNQAELIARPLGRRLGVPVRPMLLVRTKPRPDKLKLSRKERWRIVRGAYGMRGGSQVDKLRVLLVDDVFTTGATLDACARVLRKGGAARVVGVTVARVVPAWWSPSSGQEPGSRTR